MTSPQADSSRHSAATAEAVAEMLRAGGVVNSETFEEMLCEMQSHAERVRAINIRDAAILRLLAAQMREGDKCPVCKGSKQERIYGGGGDEVVIPCSYCEGRGSLIALYDEIVHALEIEDSHDDPIEAIERLNAALAAAEQQRQRVQGHLGNLLARIFRDGGHRQAEFATLDEAVEAADTLCAEYIAGIEQRQRDVAQACPKCGFRDNPAISGRDMS